jgi:DNA-binding phage protein
MSTPARKLVKLTQEEVELAADYAEMAAYNLLNQIAAVSKLSNVEISEASGIDKSRVSKILSSPKNLTLSTFGALLRAMGYWFAPDALSVRESKKFYSDKLCVDEVYTQSMARVPSVTKFHVSSKFTGRDFTNTTMGNFFIKSNLDSGLININSYKLSGSKFRESEAVQ